MNLLFSLGQSVSGTFTDDTLAGPIQRVLNAHHNLLNAINIAEGYNNETRAARLSAFRTRWEGKASALLGKRTVKAEPEDDYTECVQYSFVLYGEVTAALAVND